MSPPRRLLPDARRRGWCPGLARPMPTGDGLLARVHPPLGILSALQMRVIADAAARFGNDHVDVTARANLQIRGLDAASAASLAGIVTDVGLGDVRDDGGPQRLTLTSPLAGLDPTEPRDVPALARALEAAGRGVAALPAKTLVAVVGPGVPDAQADLVLEPRRDHVRIALAGDPGPPRALVPEAVVPAVAALLRRFAGTGRRRIRDLDAAERAAARAGLAGHDCPEGPFAAPAPLSPGVARCGPGWRVTVEAPFGRAHARQLHALTAVAKGLGAPDIRLTPGRGVVLLGSDETAARAALDALGAAGFVTRAHDPRRAVAACPGAPACAAGSTPVPDHAAQLAAAFAPFAARGLTAHVSGCAKGCAHPAPADLTLVAEAGLYRVAPGCGPAEAGGPALTFEAALERVRRADPGLPPARAF